MAVFAVSANPWVRAEPVITAVITVGRANGSSSAGYTAWMHAHASHFLPDRLELHLLVLTVFHYSLAWRLVTSARLYGGLVRNLFASRFPL